MYRLQLDTYIFLQISKDNASSRKIEKQKLKYKQFVRF